MAQVPAETLRQFEPLASLSDSRLKEFGALCFAERVSRELNPFRIKSAAGQWVFLLAGTIEMTLASGEKRTVQAGSPEAKQALNQGIEIADSRAVTDVELMRIDSDLLDIMVTWDELAAFDAAKTGKLRALSGADAEAIQIPADWAVMSGVFSVSNLRNGAWSRLPPAHIGELLARFVRVEAKAGQVIIREGDEGDYYYVIESGRAQVTRTVGGVTVVLADLKAGDAFGEEALVSDAKRNATVAMRSDGALLKLGKSDFVSLLKEPLLGKLSMAAAEELVKVGAQWVDVRYPSEFQYDRVPGAINVPLAEIRNAFATLAKGRKYLVYCQSGRRSAAAAFLLAQRGFDVALLDGGLWAHRAPG
jgi:rhodanese-related sulfurtransferase